MTPIPTVSLLHEEQQTQLRAINAGKCKTDEECTKLIDASLAYQAMADLLDKSKRAVEHGDGDRETAIREHMRITHAFAVAHDRAKAAHEKFAGGKPVQMGPKIQLLRKKPDATNESEVAILDFGGIVGPWFPTTIDDIEWAEPEPAAAIKLPDFTGDFDIKKPQFLLPYFNKEDLPRLARAIEVFRDAFPVDLMWPSVDWVFPSHVDHFLCAAYPNMCRLIMTYYCTGNHPMRSTFAQTSCEKIDEWAANMRWDAARHGFKLQTWTSVRQWRAWYEACLYLNHPPDYLNCPPDSVVTL